MTQIFASQVSVGLVAIQLVAARAGRTEVRLKSAHTTNGVIFIGPTNAVTAANGFPVVLLGTGNSQNDFTLVPVDQPIWAIRASGAGPVGILEIAP
jgi:hypothetical protein